MNEYGTGPGDASAATPPAFEGARGARVALVRLDSDAPGIAELRESVLSMPLLPGQHRFVRPATHTLPRADADPNRVPFAVLLDEETVGFGILDRVGNLAELTGTPSRAVLFRAFYIAPEWQGRGLGSAACAALDTLVRDAMPDATEVLLTVNEANTAAVRAYVAGGFRDTGRRYLEGGAGPQRIMSRPVPP